MVPYALEALIETRLTANIATLNQNLDSALLILRAASIHGMPRQHNYSIYIIPQGLKVDEQRRGQVALTESVMVVTVIRNPATQISGTDVLYDVGQILVKIINLLLGWIPSVDCEALEMDHAPDPEFEAGFGFYPLAFKTRYVLSGVLS